ncbi:hypothetical protein GCM10011316_11350 [Roseibium aquae]|uniref:Polysaccharide deacetylase n=1 Tax=Roseibium aquae TaxID=1323746 RepID=A0A916WZ95_9HYPH|nr:polysaccharide deacetylase family protein [Roseibium aquae]GGB41131.1 hypothetical protein GCM10011316_11350 [Roseibium aquae]
MTPDLARFRSDLTRHLDWFAERRRKARFWWRDDDATRPSTELDRLLTIANTHGVEVALAVIPKDAEPALAARLAREPHAVVLQHGWQHANFQRADLGEKSAELGSRRDVAEALAELSEGRRRLDTLFGGRFVPVLVPPWNRIAPALSRRLETAGLSGLSTFTWMHAPHPAQIQTHVDMVDWRKGRGFIGWAEASRRLDLQLCRRRTNSSEPIGLLSHHLVMDEGSFTFLDELLRIAAHHPGADWPGVRSLVMPPAGGNGGGWL